MILQAFSSPNEDIKTAASFALGAVAVGNLTHYLPFVLKEIDSQSKRQYLLLHSLKVSLNSAGLQLLFAVIVTIHGLT